MKLLHSTKLAVVMALIATVASVNVAMAQFAKETDFTTSITYQNVGDGDATVIFQFRNQNTAESTDVERTLPQGAGDSLFLGTLSGDEALDPAFLGSAVVSADQPIVATVVQVPPQGAPVLNRPLSNGFKTATPEITFATVLKKRFGTQTTTVFSVQNATTAPADFEISIFNSQSPTDAPIIVTDSNVPGGAAIHYDMAALTEVSAAQFDGSALVKGTVTGSDTPANIVGAASELAEANLQAKAFEAVAGGANTLFMASALCNVFGAQETAYAVTNTSTDTAADVTVTYSSGETETANIAAGTKRSFLGCAVNAAGFTGAAEVTSVGAPIAVVGKKFILNTVFETAFNGELQGFEDLALPYVRYTSDANYNDGTGAKQRANIAISNAGDAEVTNVVVRYLNKAGTEVGAHTIASIPIGGKANSNPLNAGSGVELEEFGTPAANASIGGGFGGSVIIDGPTGAQLVAIASITSKTAAGQVQEDYNGVSPD